MPSGIYIRTEEHKQNISGKNHFNYGKHLSKETKRKISESHKDIHPSKETRRKLSKSLKGRVVSEEKRQSMRGENNFYGQHYSGAKNPNWKGGIASLENLIRSNFNYRQWRDDIYVRDKFTCQICGDNRGHNLNAHHIKSFTKIIQFYEITTLEEALSCEELWNINNGITLCGKCHYIIHKKKKCLYIRGDKNGRKNYE